MRFVPTTALIFLFFQAGQGPAPAVIEGLVLQAASGEPIAKAQVTLTRVVSNPTAILTTPPPAPIPQIPPTLTDAAGKFSFANLEPGSYRVIAGKNGFVRMNYGERFSGGPGTVVNAPSGQTLNVSFRLIQTAAVSGRVRDSSGELGAGLAVQLLKPSYNPAGQRTFQTVASGRTDDRGEYRLFWISPGRYYLAVTTNRNSLSLISIEGTLLLGGGASPNEIASPGQATVYYPGTVDPLRASTIEVGAGGEQAGVDVLLPQQTLYRVQGRVVDSSTGQPPRSAGISLMSRDTSLTTLTTSLNTNYNPTTGTFDLRDVVPGAYWLRAQAAESTATALIPANAVGRTVSEALTMASGIRTAAQMSLDVTGNVDGLVLSMTSGVSVPGSLRVEGQPLPASPAPRVALRSTSTSGLSSPLQPINADGTFTLLNVFPGEYRVMVTPMPPDYYVKEARNEQVDVLNQPWVIGNAIRGNLEVVLSSAVGQIEGTVLDARSQPVASLQTILIPDQDRGRIELVKTVVTDQNGHFNFRGVSPGNYKIFAWEGLEANAFYDPEVMRQYEQQGKAVRVTEGAKITSEVRMIPAKQ